MGTNTGVGNGIGIEFMVIRLGPVVDGCTDGSSTSSPSGYTTAGATQRLEVILGTRDLPLSTEMALHRREMGLVDWWLYLNTIPLPLDAAAAVAAPLVVVVVVL